MKVLVTGATGFVGRHVVARLLARGHAVTAVARDEARAARMPWAGAAAFVRCDLHADYPALLQQRPLPDVLLHLAWPGLPNYRDFFHVERNLPADLAFLGAAVEAGIGQIAVTGTCLEYGMQYGPLREGQPTCPSTPYGFAKDALRKALQVLQASRPFTLQWIRLFYMHGEGQNRNSLLAQLDRAIDEGSAEFDMSAGEQLRDYLPIERVAEKIVQVLEAPACNGIINCCSGEPVSVRSLVERRCRERGAGLQLNLGRYPYPDYEPLAFWGVPHKLAQLAQAPP